MMESISSMKIVAGWLHFAVSNKIRIVFSLSPWYLDTMELAEILKIVLLHSDATAFANIVFPVPGEPKSKIPFHGYKFNSSKTF